MFCDFGIMIIKPDGVEQGAEEILEEELRERGIKVLCKNKRTLSQKDVNDFFYYKFNEYIDYMTSGAVCSYLISSNNIDMDTEIFFLKSKIRKIFEVNGKMTRNIIHGAHCGTEFFVQRRLFFPEYEKKEFTSYADPLVEVSRNNIDRISEITRDLTENSKIQKYILCFEYNDLIESETAIRYVIENEEHVAISHSTYFENKDINVITFLPTSRLKKEMLASEKKLLSIESKNSIKCIDLNLAAKGGRLLRNISDIETYQNNIEQMHMDKLYSALTDLKKDGIGIDAMVVNKANLELEEAEVRFELAMKLKLIPVIGSFDERVTGLFGCSPGKFEKLSKILL